MDWLLSFPTQHPYAFAAISTWVTNYGVSAFVSSLPAPTAKSSPLYQFFFKFATTILAQNPSRGLKPPAVETSPNFQDSVNQLNAQQGVKKTIVEVPEQKG